MAAPDSSRAGTRAILASMATSDKRSRHLLRTAVWVPTNAIVWLLRLAMEDAVTDRIAEWLPTAPGILRGPAEFLLANFSLIVLVLALILTPVSLWMVFGSFLKRIPHWLLRRVLLPLASPSLLKLSLWSSTRALRLHMVEYDRAWQQFLEDVERAETATSGAERETCIRAAFGHFGDMSRVVRLASTRGLVVLANIASAVAERWASLPLQDWTPEAHRWAAAYPELAAAERSHSALLAQITDMAADVDEMENRKAMHRAVRDMLEIVSSFAASAYTMDRHVQTAK